MSRSYAASLPSSLTRVTPNALVCSTFLPVSVCGTGKPVSSLRGFSRPPLRSLVALRHALGCSADQGISLLASWPHSLGTSLHPEADLHGGVPPSLAGLVPDCSPVVHRLRLAAAAKARLTRRGLTFRRKPQVFGACGSHTCLRYSCRHSHFSSLHTRFPLCFDRMTTLPY